MEKEVLAWGNSSGIRFKKEDLEVRRIEQGDTLVFTITKIIKNGRREK